MESGIGEFRRFVSDSAVQQTATNVVRQGELLVVTRTGVGKLAIAPCDIAISQDITGLYPDRDRVDVRFLFHRMKLGVEALKRLNQGTSINGIVRDDLLSYRFNLPPMHEQQFIAEVLSTLDETIQQTKALIAKMQRVKAGMMHDLFTRGILPNGEMRRPREEAPQLYKESSLGWIPKEWEVRRLEQVAEVNRGKFSIRPRNDPRYYGGEFPFIQTGDVAIASGRIVSAYTQTLNLLGLSVSRLFPVGTIMVTIAANIADTCILGIPMCAPDSLVGVVPKQDATRRFIELCIRRRKRWLENGAPQTAQKNINLEDLRPLCIQYPQEEEQSQISERYEAIDRQIGEYERVLRKLEMTKSGLMHDLLTGRVRIPESMLTRAAATT
jgi:type I restriction enzyme S subunit